MNSFVLLKFASSLLLPPASTAAGVLIGAVLLAAGFRRAGRTLFVVAVLQGILFSLPPVADLLIAPLERQAREAAQFAEPCCYSAIVLLGGAIVPATPVWMPSFHLLEGADRIVYAAELFHSGVAPRIVVSGGRVDAASVGGTEAEAMKEMLVLLGVPADAIVTEDRSRNTLDNIAFVHQLIGDERVALVTSAYHMPRALKIAREARLEAFAFPTDWQVPAGFRPLWENWLPTLGAERNSFLALREYFALVLDYRRPIVPSRRRTG